MARIVAERGDIIPALGELFREYGFEGASLKIISERTGLGKGSLYHFFPGGKEEMASAVLKNVSAWFEEKIFAPLECATPEKALPCMFEAVTEYFKSGRRVCLVGAFALNESRSRFPLAINSYFLRWVQALSNCLVRGGLSQPKAHALAQEVVAGIQGAIILSRALDATEPFMNVMQRLQGHCQDSAAAVAGSGSL